MAQSVYLIVNNQGNSVLNLSRIFQKYIFLNRILFFSFLFFNLLSVVLYIYTPQIISKIIDDAIANHNKELIINLTLLVILLYATAYIFSFFSNILYTKLSIKSYIKFNFTLVEHIQKLPLKFFETQDVIYLSNRISSDTEDIISFILNNIINIVVNTITIIVISFIIFINSGCLLLFIFLSTCVLDLLCYKLYKSYIYTTSYEKKEYENKFFSAMNYQLLRIVFIKTNVIYKYLKDISFELFSRYMLSVIKFSKINSGYVNIGKFLRSFSMILALTVGGLLCIDDYLNIGILISLIAYFNIGYKCLDEFHEFGKTYQDILVSVSRINDIIKEKQEFFGREKPSEISFIDIRNLSFGYNDQLILTSFNAHFEKGNIYIVKGKNGSGKSTLANLLLGLYDIKENIIYFNNYDIKSIDLNFLRRRIISFVEQEPILINHDIDTNIFLDSDKTNENYNALLFYADKLNFLQKYKILKSSSTKLGDFENVLSGGEKQKVSIIRSLLKNAPVMIFDEPTSALDVKSISGFWDILTSIQQDKIIIIITHDVFFENTKAKVINF